MCLRSIKIVIIFSIAILLGSCYVKGYSQEKEPATGFQYISPIAIVNDMNPGWNLGNTLDAIPTEGAWNNPPVETYVFDDAQKAGFKSVRLPVTWAEHIGPAPDYKVDPKWFDRVEQVVDWAIERDMYIMVNAHHDSWNWLTKWATNPETHERYVEDPVNTIIKFEKLWEQIAERFKNKNEKLIFEVINEPDGSPARVNEINHRILKVIRNTGGNNKYRLVVLPARWTSTIDAMTNFVTPDDDHIAITCHYYAWPFFLRGAPTWGSMEEKQWWLEREFWKLGDKFVKNGIPVIIGEWGADQPDEAYYPQLYTDSIVRAAYINGITTMVWDPGGSARTDRTWIDSIGIQLIVNASKGIPNSFVIQPTIYVEANKTITDYTVNLELKGNQLEGIYNGNYNLINSIDYILTNDNSRVTIKKEYLQTLIKPGQIGKNVNLTFKFSQGADQVVKVLQYDQPQISETFVTISKPRPERPARGQRPEPEQAQPQNSSVNLSTLYFKLNTPPTDKTLDLRLNKNHFKGIYNGSYTLNKGADYTIIDDVSRVTLKKEYLEKLLKKGQIGVNAELTFKFSQGEDQMVKIIQYDQPTSSEISLTLDTSKEYSDLTIPIDFKGLQPSYVSAVEKKTNKSINNRLALDDGNVMYGENMTTATLSGRWVLNVIKEDTLITFHFWPRNVKAEIDVKVVEPASAPE